MYQIQSQYRLCIQSTEKYFFESSKEFFKKKLTINLLDNGKISVDECSFLELFKFLYTHLIQVARKTHLTIQLLS